ncbi:MAG: zinc-ribbon domain-containing protein [Elusimicrobiota bacterium]
MNDRCPQCGVEVSENDTACPQCGRKFSGPAGKDPRFSSDPDPKDSAIPSWLSRVEDDEPEPPPKRGTLSACLFVLGGAAAIIAAIYAPKFLPELKRGAKPAASTSAEVPATPPAFPESSTAPKPEKPVSIKTFTPVDESAGGADTDARWRLRGVLFDLDTAKPAKGAVIVFQDPKTNQRYRASANASGRYRAALSVNEDGYTLAIWYKKGFRTYVEDWIPSLKTLSKEKRADVAQGLADSFDQEKLYGTEGQKIEKDFAIGPPMSVKTGGKKEETAEPEEGGEEEE